MQFDLLVILFFVVKLPYVKKLQRPSALISVRCSKCRKPKIVVVWNNVIFQCVYIEY